MCELRRGKPRRPPLLRAVRCQRCPSAVRSAGLRTSPMRNSAAAAAVRSAPLPLRAPGCETAEAERRPVTVLFADLCGYTRLSEGTDPEDVTRAARTLFRRCRRDRRALRRARRQAHRRRGDGGLRRAGRARRRADPRGPRRRRDRPRDARASARRSGGRSTSTSVLPPARSSRAVWAAISIARTR